MRRGRIGPVALAVLLGRQPSAAARALAIVGLVVGGEDRVLREPVLRTADGTRVTLAVACDLLVAHGEARRAVEDLLGELEVEDRVARQTGEPPPPGL